jgi:glutamine phosphoribosylpyrophosphate amidotransferase
MCSVIGAIIQKPTQEDFETLHKVFIESRIRGLHATGISYVKEYTIHTIKRPVSADLFRFDWDDYVNEDGNLYLVGHCRYSTSDLEYNQPINNQTTSVVHNGVITQELPENWEKLYGYKCETKNDTELILHTIDDDKSPLEVWKDSSLAVCELWFCKRLKVYRNGKRPLYLTSLSNGCIITSTKDVIERAGIKEATYTAPVPMNTYITFDEHLTMSMEKADVEGVDYQIGV